MYQLTHSLNSPLSLLSKYLLWFHWQAFAGGSKSSRTYILCILGSNTGSLHDELFVAKLHSVQTRTRLRTSHNTKTTFTFISILSGHQRSRPKNWHQWPKPSTYRHPAEFDVNHTCNAQVNPVLAEKITHTTCDLKASHTNNNNGHLTHPNMGSPKHL